MTRLRSRLRRALLNLRDVDVWVAVAIVAALVALILRIVLFQSERLYGRTAEFYANLGLAALVGVAVLVTARRLAKPDSQSGDKSAASTLGVTGAAIGLPAAAIAAIQLLIPATDYDAAEPACAGVPILNAPFLAQTINGGVNARAGAAVGYEQRNRFAGGCTLGFDGYCIGEPIPEKRSELEDTRWYIVHGKDYLVSAAKVLDQSPTSKLSSEPDPACETKYGGIRAPGELSFTPALNDGVTVGLKTHADRASLVGYAVYSESPRSGVYGYSLVGLVSEEPDFVGTWNAASAGPELRKGSGHIQLAAAVCLAADVPYGDPAVYDATFRGNKVVTLKEAADIDEEHADRLRRTACSGSP
jgi:hypothetical protein